jgi:N-acetylmuramoyl-L-alanine amidase
VTRAALALAICLAALAASRGDAAPDARTERARVESVRHWSYRDYTRVVVELSRPVETRAERLAADPAAGRPERLYLDLPGVWVGHDWDAPQPVDDGLLAAIRLGQFSSARARLVLDLAQYDRHRMFALTGPERLVIDVYGRARASDRVTTAERSAAPSRTGLADPAPKPAGAAPDPRRLLVVLDPGHGGEDPGTHGGPGLFEKDITLAVARSAQRRLEERGFDVRMTRDRDRTLTLEERTAFAEGVGGDVFVSIHVNAAPRPRVRGIETYYLDANFERHALRVAARESGVAPGDLDALQRALAGFKVSELGARSAALARAVQSEVVLGVKDAYGSVEDLGVKRGPFHVLFLSEAPAVLVEVGFLSNPVERKRLASAPYREVLAEQIARGLSRYRRERGAALAQSGR